MNRTVLGIVGGIGSGKSTVARFLARLGARVLDADRTAKECLQDPAVLTEIRQVFGKEVFLPEGGVDRRRLADRAFSDPEALARLNTILHPRVRARIREALQNPGKEGDVVVLDVPLLVGSELARLCDKVVAVRAPARLRLERVARDRGWDAQELARRESFQPSQAEKEAAADFIIENDGSLESLERKVRELYRALRGGEGSPSGSRDG